MAIRACVIAQLESGVIIPEGTPSLLLTVCVVRLTAPSWECAMGKFYVLNVDLQTLGPRVPLTVNGCCWLSAYRD